MLVLSRYKMKAEPKEIVRCCTVHQVQDIERTVAIVCFGSKSRREATTQKNIDERSESAMQNIQQTIEKSSSLIDDIANRRQNVSSNGSICQYRGFIPSY